jgi:hypothetical protein
MRQTKRREVVNSDTERERERERSRERISCKMVGNGELDSPECCAPYSPFDDESHDRLIDTPKTDEITITQHPGDYP